MTWSIVRELVGFPFDHSYLTGNRWTSCERDRVAPKGKIKLVLKGKIYPSVQHQTHQVTFKGTPQSSGSLDGELRPGVPLWAQAGFPLFNQKIGPHPIQMSWWKLHVDGVELNIFCSLWLGSAWIFDLLSPEPKVEAIAAEKASLRKAHCLKTVSHLLNTRLDEG